MNTASKVIFLTAALAGCGDVVSKHVMSCDVPSHMSSKGRDHGLSVRGFIDEQSAGHFIGALDHEIETQGHGIELVVPIDSPGGMVDHAAAMQARLEQLALTNDVTLVCDDRAESSAGVLLATTKGVNRDAAVSCMVMLHSALFSIDYMRGCSADSLWEGVSGPGLVFKYPEIYGAQQALDSDPNAKKIEVGARDFNSGRLVRDYDLTREQARYLVNGVSATNNMFANKFAEATDLNQRDVWRVLAGGDVYFNVDEAAFLGMIDTIEGQDIPQDRLERGANTVCSKFPELSVCSAGIDTFTHLD